MSAALSITELMQFGVRVHYDYAAGSWWVGIPGCVGLMAYISDHQGWMREGSINGPYLCKHGGQPIHASDSIVALALAWYDQQVVH